MPSSRHDGFLSRHASRPRLRTGFPEPLSRMAARQDTTFGSDEGQARGGIVLLGPALWPLATIPAIHSMPYVQHEDIRDGCDDDALFPGQAAVPRPCCRRRQGPQTALRRQSPGSPILSCHKACRREGMLTSCTRFVAASRRRLTGGITGARHTLRERRRRRSARRIGSHAARRTARMVPRACMFHVRRTAGRHRLTKSKRGDKPCAGSIPGRAGDRSSWAGTVQRRAYGNLGHGRALVHM